MKIAIIGATGLVGTNILKVLEESKVFSFLKAKNITAVASSQSIGKELFYKGESFWVKGLTETIALKPDIAIFSAGSKISTEWAKEFINVGSVVIDNSSAWRNTKNIPLIIPEVNIGILKKTDKLIANPNCSTIQMLVALYPLHKQYKIKRIVVSTYQAVSGSGYKAVAQLDNEREKNNSPKFYLHQIDLNVLGQIGSMLNNLYTDEEMKLIDETRKILNEPSMLISPTAVRVPVYRGHSLSLNVEFENNIDIVDMQEILNNAPGIAVKDDPESNTYPMPIDCENKNEVFVGRLRGDPHLPNTINMWVVADNIRKGAATNAVQIAEYVYTNFID